jgi:hypothetical protein
MKKARAGSGEGGDDAACDFTFVVGYARRSLRGLVDASLGGCRDVGQAQGSDKLQRECRSRDKLMESAGSVGRATEPMKMTSSCARARVKAQRGGGQTRRQFFVVGKDRTVNTSEHSGCVF